jgi:Acetyltransferase (GNAT) domain
MGETVTVAEAEPVYEAASGDLATQLRWQPYDQSRGLWLELLGSCANATIYHRARWIEVIKRTYGLHLWLATLHRGDALAAGLVFARAPLSKRYIALSFSDTFAPLARDADAAHELLAALAALAPAGTSYELRGMGGVDRWETVDCFANWRLNLDRPLAALERGLATNFRRNLRRAARQAIAIERGSGVEDLKRFFALQLESRRRLGIPPQPWRFFDLIRQIFAESGDFEVWTARDSGVDVASAVFLRDGDEVHYKWGARRPNDRSDGNHLLFWNAIEEFARTARVLDVGRADVRNRGLMRFKSELGAQSSLLPWSFYPHAPKQVSAEVLTGKLAVLAKIWTRVPIPVTRLAGRVVYRYFA